MTDEKRGVGEEECEEEEECFMQSKRDEWIDRSVEQGRIERGGRKI
jgi:hypothetical protein